MLNSKQLSCLCDLNEHSEQSSEDSLYNMPTTPITTNDFIVARNLEFLALLLKER